MIDHVEELRQIYVGDNLIAFGDIGLRSFRTCASLVFHLGAAANSGRDRALGAMPHGSTESSSTRKL